MSDEPTGEFIRLQTALAGRYFLERELGRGGMGIVYLARDVALDRLVALKLLPRQFSADPSLRQRFLSEARTAAKLSHPNIIPIHSVEEVGDLVFFVMAFVDGETLGERVRSRGPIPPSELARVLREVAWGLAYAHAQGVVHRDVKADNILLERGSARALIADFGIARVTQAGGVTGVGEILGTAEYMSPEQASGEAVDGRSDIYSLGVVAFYALAGKLPFEGPTVASILAKQITQPSPPIATACEGVPGKLAHAVDRCLAKDPAQRFEKAEDLADTIGSAIEARRELPVPVRVFFKKVREMNRLLAGMAFMETYFSMVGVGMWFSGQPWVGVGVMGLGTMLLLIPTTFFLYHARTLLKAGFGREDVIVAWKGELEREREERAFEYGRTATLIERLGRWVGALGGFTAINGGLWLAIFGKVGRAPAQAAVGLGIMFGLLGGIVALLRYERRTNLGGRLMTKVWASPVGRWMFRVAGAWLKREAIQAPATHRPTELAIGMAVDALFEALPKPARKQLGDLPKVVRGLEDDAMKMRRRVDELNEMVAKMDAGNRVEATSGASTELQTRRQSLDRDIHAARDAAKQRLGDAVTALEGIRLNLLRLTAGAGSVDSLTADLTAAREVSENVGLLLQGQREVELALRKPA